MKTNLKDFILEVKLSNISSIKTFKAPEFLYHLTSSKYIESIKEIGLKIEHSQQHNFEIGIYLADSFLTASNYSLIDGKKDDYYMIEIPFNKLETKYMKPDDYELYHTLDDDEFDSYIEILDEFGINKDNILNNPRVFNEFDYRLSLNICGQLLYVNDIRPELFSKIYNKEEIDNYKNKY